MLAVATMLWTSVANGEIRSFAATVESEVKEFAGGSPSDSEFAFDSFPGVSTSNLPMNTQVGFSRTGPDGAVVAEGRAVTTFSDPRLSALPSPEEFGISSLTVSSDASLSHNSRCKTTETRTIVFTAADTGLADDTAIRVRSQFFLDGIAVLWTTASVSDLSNVWTTLHLDIVQERPDAVSVTVLTADITLTGAPEEKAILQTAGAVTADNLIILDLNGAVSDLSAVQGVLIPDIAIPYEYDTAVGESFTLKATVEAVSNSEPGGHGAAVVLGVPLLDLAQLINNVTGGTAGTLLTDLAKTTSQTVRPKAPLLAGKDLEIRALGTSPDDDPFGVNERLLRPLCGTLGLEVPLMLAVSGTMMFMGRRRV